MLQPTPALLDKDTLFSGLSRRYWRLAVVRMANASAWYDAHVKVHEYAGLTAAARQIRILGCSVVLARAVHRRDPRWCALVVVGRRARR